MNGSVIHPDSWLAAWLVSLVHRIRTVLDWRLNESPFRILVWKKKGDKIIKTNPFLLASMSVFQLLRAQVCPPLPRNWEQSQGVMSLKARSTETKASWVAFLSLPLRDWLRMSLAVTLTHSIGEQEGEAEGSEKASEGGGVYCGVCLCRWLDKAEGPLMV